MLNRTTLHIAEPFVPAKRFFPQDAWRSCNVRGTATSFSEVECVISEI